MNTPTTTEAEDTSDQETVTDLESPHNDELPTKKVAPGKKKVPLWAKYTALIAISVTVVLPIVLPVSRSLKTQTYKVQVTEYSNWIIDNGRGGRPGGFGNRGRNMPRFGEGGPVARPRSSSFTKQGNGPTVELVAEVLAVGEIETFAFSQDDNVTINDRTFVINLVDINSTDAMLLVKYDWAARKDCAYTARLHVAMEGGIGKIEYPRLVGSCTWDEISNLSVDISKSLTATVTAN
jgi:hypothetical protein